MKEKTNPVTLVFQNLGIDFKSNLKNIIFLR